MTSVQSVQIENFRGFREHTVPLDPITILVGQNNAGKSTFIDALRLLSVALRRLRTAQFQSTPTWLADHAIGFGYRSSFETVDFDFGNTHYNYDNHNPAKLQILFRNRVRLTLWLGTDEGNNFAQISTPSTGPMMNRAEALKLVTCPILVMPPIGALHPHETMIARDRVNEFMFGRLASRHFRNQLWGLSEQYQDWKNLLESTWPNLRVNTFMSDGGQSGKELALILREGPFASEVAWVGSGLQAWMQILWFVCRADRNSLVVLDEPDVFLHADMQRKIAKIVINREFRQAAIATHSAEIIGDVDPASITVIRKRERSSWKPGRKAEIQKVVDSLGSRHNLQLSKLAAARKIVLYEGDDQKFLSEVSLKISSDAYQRFSAIPSFEISGVENWKQAIGAARALHAVSDGSIPVYLVIDRDYRPDAEIEEMRVICGESHLSLHCWSRKEVENFLIDAATIRGLVAKKSPSITMADIERLIQDSAQSLRSYTVGAIADQWQLKNRKASPSNAYKEAEARLDELQGTRPVHEIVSGKRLISALSSKSKEAWGTSFGPMTLCRAMPLSAYSDELVGLVKKLTT